MISHFIPRHHQIRERGLPGRCALFVHDIVIANATWQNGEIAQISGPHENKKLCKLEVIVISITADYSAENNYIAKYKDCLVANYLFQNCIKTHMLEATYSFLSFISGCLISHWKALTVQNHIHYQYT